MFRHFSRSVDSPSPARTERKVRPSRWLGVDQEAATAAARFHLARFLIVRLLGLVYLAAFAIFVNQGLPLLGSHGLLPIDEFTARVAGRLGSTPAAFARLPSVFWLAHSDALLLGLAWCGAVLALLVLLGVTNAAVMAALWALYMSYVHVGQDWYGYGWEIQLLETGFLAIFLCPLRSIGPFPRTRPAPLVIVLFRWLIFRVMLGAGLIKIRGDSCWRDLTCLLYHYETQPNPNPFSRVLHFAPQGVAIAGALFNHVTELVMPWLLLCGRWATRVAGVFFVAFQISLIVSGNLSFLNWLTIVPALACFDDAMLGRLMPRAFGRFAEDAERAAAERSASERSALRRARAVTVAALCALVAWLSVPVVENLMSGHQMMNTSFDTLNLVNTYGAFGSVGRERREIVFEGTTDAVPDGRARWREYQFKCAPCDPVRPPCVITPYHYRLDWQIWFAAMASPNDYPWTLRFVWKLLHNDEGSLSLLAGNPFPETPPRYVRARLYIYRFARPGSGRFWNRDLVGDWIPPLSADDPRLREFLRAYGWRSDGAAGKGGT
jgi:lipase maturation factor